MRRTWAGVLGLALLAPVWADDKPPAPAVKTPLEQVPDEKAAPAAKTPKEQIDELKESFQKEMTELSKQFQEAKTNEEKQKLRQKVFEQVAPGFAKKVIEVAAANPKDAAALDGLVFVCTDRLVGRTPAIPDAVKALLKDHADSAKLGVVCQAIQQREDGDKLIALIREKATSKTVKLLAGHAIAMALLEKDELTPEQTKQAEKLLEEFAADAKGDKDIAPAMIEDAASAMKLFIGKQAPAAESKDLDDKAVKLADLKGKVVVLDFWATWCPPCRGMIPHEREMVKKFKDKPFAFVSVSADEDKETLTKFLKDEPMPWMHWFAGQGGDVLKSWRIRAFPTIYVIDAKGVIRGKIVGGGPEAEKKLDTLVDKLVKEATGKES